MCTPISPRNLPITVLHDQMPKDRPTVYMRLLYCNYAILLVYDCLQAPKVLNLAAFYAAGFDMQMCFIC